VSQTESVRISKELKQELKKIAEEMRPRSAIQYLIEDAVEQYLRRITTSKKRSERSQKKT